MFNAGTVLSSDSDRQGRKMVVMYVRRQLHIQIYTIGLTTFDHDHYK